MAEGNGFDPSPAYAPKNYDPLVAFSAASCPHLRLAREELKKFEFLVSSGVITPLELEATVNEARKKGSDVASILMEKYRVTKKELGISLSLFYGCPFMEFDGGTVVPPELVRSISLNYLKANYWIPLKRDGGAVEVLIDDPHSFQKVQDIKKLFQVNEIRFRVGLCEDILKFVHAIASQLESSPSRDPIAAILGELVSQDQEKGEETAAPAIDENDSAIVRLANQTIVDAYQAGASDIHLEPRSDRKEALIRFRVDGDCYEYQKVPSSYRRALSSRFKIMAHLDISERRKPQDGKIRFRLPDREIELRVATLPTQGVDNEDVVMRILTTSEPIPLEKLNMSERNLREFKLLLEQPYGLILCVGPTGSGKTTTLHAALRYLNDPETKIWTAEDPVEITQDGLRQVQVQPRIGFDFATAMRAFLRADPDVIMVGEMRDRETCEIAIEASLTGHLVLSTLHTNSAVETVTRLLEMGMDPFNFCDALLGVLGQRLVRTICQSCKESYHPSTEEQDALVRAYGEKVFSELFAQKDVLLYRGKGCDACKKTGYKGRTCIHELLVVTDEIKKLVQSRAPVGELYRVAVEQGMATLVQDGLMKCLQGWTDYKQVKAVAMK